MWLLAIVLLGPHLKPGKVAIIHELEVKKQKGPNLLPRGCALLDWGEWGTEVSWRHKAGLTKPLRSLCLCGGFPFVFSVRGGDTARVEGVTGEVAVGKELSRSKEDSKFERTMIRGGA